MVSLQIVINLTFFSIWIFFHEHSRITRLQGKREGISLSPHCDFHPLHRHLYISRAIIAESSPLHVASNWTPTGNLWFPSASRQPLSSHEMPCFALKVSLTRVWRFFLCILTLLSLTNNSQKCKSRKSSYISHHILALS